MKSFTDPRLFPAKLPNPHVTIGNYDGVHFGHQQILKQLVREARAGRGTSVVITFQPHPLRILLPESAPPLILTSTQKLAAFAAQEIDFALSLPFDEAMARWSPRQFVERALVECVAAKRVLVGTNFVFGYQQRGNLDTLKMLGGQFGFSVEGIAQYTRRGTRVSSSLIRGLLLEGKVLEAGRLLGRFFTLVGPVIPGEALGRKVTVPTLNLSPENELIPKSGVYITKTSVHSTIFPSVTNVGTRPTFHDNRLTVESHLLGVRQMEAPGRIELSFLHRLRDERRFESPEALKAQIERDIQNAQKFFDRLNRFRTPLRSHGNGPSPQ